MTWTIAPLDDEGESSVESDGRCVSTYSYTWLVGTDAGTRPTKAAIVAALGVTRGSPCSEDANAICHKVKVNNWSSPTRPPFLLFKVKVDYATNATLPDTEDDDPTTRRTLWSGSTSQQQRYIIEDKDGTLITDTAGQPFDGGVGVNERIGVQRFTRNVDAAGYDRDAMMANNDKVNSVSFLGGDPGTVQLEFSSDECYEGGWHFYKESYSFFYNPLGWQPNPVNAGFYCRDEVDGPVRRILNADIGDDDPRTMDEPCPEPQPLDEDGLIVPVADRPADCIKVTVDHFDEMDFNTFGL